MSESITICCLKWGDKYGAEYVNILYAMVQRNVSVPCDFVCFTDDPKWIDAKIRTEPMPYVAPRWWGKMGLYLPRVPGINTERLLFLDLDVCITGSLDEMLLWPETFVMAKDWPSGIYPPTDIRDRQGNSSVVLLKVGAREDIWKKFYSLVVSTGVIPRFAHGDQEWVNGYFPDSMTVFPERFVKSYKLHNLSGERDPDCSVVMFHGEPKPPDCGGWVKRHWRI